MVRLVVFILFLFLMACTHSPGVVLEFNPVSVTKTITPSCATCSSDPICAVVDDIDVNGTTVYTSCNALTSGQGEFTKSGLSCLIWTPNGHQTDTVTTCIVACTAGKCDSTIIRILPFGDTIVSGNPCNPDIVYFEKDVLPILTANCAYSGCHNAISRREGIIYDNYTNTINTGRVKPFSISNSKLYKVITTGSGEDVMPPSPARRLNTEEVNIIAKWIRDGAKNEICDSNSIPCNTDNISYTTFVKPVLASCTNCHKVGNAGGGIILDSYQGMKSAAVSGKLYGSLSWSSGFIAMPQGGSKINDCNIKKIKSWIDAGTPNN